MDIIRHAETDSAWRSRTSALKRSWSAEVGAQIDQDPVFMDLAFFKRMQSWLEFVFILKSVLS